MFAIKNICITVKIIGLPVPPPSGLPVPPPPRGLPVPPPTGLPVSPPSGLPIPPPSSGLPTSSEATTVSVPVSNGGFNLSILEKAKAANKNVEEEDDDGWSDDDNNPPPAPKETKPYIPTRRQSVTAPPAVTLPPPVRKSTSESTTLNEQKIEEKLIIQESISSQSTIMKEEIPKSNPVQTTAPAPVPVPVPVTISIPTPNPVTNVTPSNTSTSLPIQQQQQQKSIVKETNLKNDENIANSMIEKLVIKQHSPKIEQVQQEIDDNDIDDKISTNSQSVRDARKIRDLEALNFDLKRKLEKAESRLAQQSFILCSKEREAELEKELDKSYDRINTLKSENSSLHDSVKALQIRLTLAETKSNEIISKPIIPMIPEKDIKNMERMKEMEKQLLKMKEDKDKVIRLIILLIGKDRMSTFLKNHANDDDILSALVDTFSNGSIDNNKTNKVNSPARKVRSNKN